MTIRSIADENSCNPAHIIYAKKCAQKRAFLMASDLQIWYDIQQCQSSVKLKKIREFYNKDKNQRITIIEFVEWLSSSDVLTRYSFFEFIDSNNLIKLVINSHKNIPEINNRRIGFLFRGMTYVQMILILVVIFISLYPNLNQKKLRYI